MSSIGKDLATIRSHLGLSLEHIHQATKIPILTLKRVENDSIFSDQEENKTYVRSFVRTYAKALKIDDDTAVKALDQYEAGRYSGQLLDAYPALSVPPASAESPEPNSPVEEVESLETTGQASEKENQPPRDRDSESTTDAESTHDQNTGAQAPSTPGNPPSTEHDDPSDASDEPKDTGTDTQPAEEDSQENRPDWKSPEKSDDHDGGPESTPDTSNDPLASAEPQSSSDSQSDSEQDNMNNDSVESVKTPAEDTDSAVSDSSIRKSVESKTPVPPTVSSVNWADMGHKFKNIDKHTPAWLIAFIIFLVIVTVVAFLLYQQGILNRFFDPSPQELTEQTENIETPPTDLNFNMPDNSESDINIESPVDSFSANQEIQDDNPAQSVQVLPDTLYITILAAYERLDPVRVWSDLKPTFNPYWMSHRNAYHFEFQDTLRVRGQFSRMQFYLNGHRIDNVVENNFVQSGDYVEITRDMFTGDPRWQSTISLELPSDTPSPTLVQDRPIF